MIRIKARSQKISRKKSKNMTEEEKKKKKKKKSDSRGEAHSRIAVAQDRDAKPRYEWERGQFGRTNGSWSIIRTVFVLRKK